MLKQPCEIIKMKARVSTHNTNSLHEITIKQYGLYKRCVVNEP